MRFHHRSIREYLTSQWFLRLLGDGKRSKVDNLFFREQYGLQIITPLLRPILPWGALADDQLRVKALRYFPEVLLEGGDLSTFPLEVRSRILTALCRDMSQPISRNHNFDVAAVERFSNKDMEDLISHLIQKHQDDQEVRELLLRMIWQGQLGSCVAQIRIRIKK